jgi:hypothetical protein
VVGFEQQNLLKRIPPCQRIGMRLDTIPGSVFPRLYRSQAVKTVLQVLQLARVLFVGKNRPGGLALVKGNTDYFQEGNNHNGADYQPFNRSWVHTKIFEK